MNHRWVVRAALAGGLAMALALAGCREERAQRVAASYSSSTKPSPAAPAPPAPRKVTVGVEAVPVEEDYEARAAATISAANLAAKSAELERELRL